MHSITIKVPDNLPMNTFDINMLIATNLFEKGIVTSGQAAEMVGLTKRAFVEIVGKYGVSIFGYDFEELEDELKNVSFKKF